MRNIVDAQSISQKINVVFLSLLNRKPTTSEKKMWLNIAKEEGAPAANDLIWILANSNEFMFIR